MKTIIQFLLKHNNMLLVFVVLITTILSIKLGNVEMREDVETFISLKSPVLIEYRDFQRVFESNEGVIVAYESDDILSDDELEYLHYLQGRLEIIAGVTEVKSVLNADNIIGVEAGIEIAPIIGYTDLQHSNTNPRKLLKNNPLFEGVFVSNDLSVNALLLDVPGMFNGGSDSLHKAFYDELMQINLHEERETGRRLYIGGDIVTDASIEKLMERDLSLLFPLSLLLSAIILFLFYRKGVTTIMPLVPVLIAIVWVLGLKGWTDIPMTPISITLFPLIMVIGIANSIHIINYYQQLRPTESSHEAAINKALSAVLKPCFLAAFTTAIGFGSLVVSNVTGIKQMGLFAAFGIISAFVLSIIIIPFALKRSNIFANNSDSERKNRILEPMLRKIDRINQRYPWRVAILFLGITISMALFIPRIKVEGSLASFAKENTRLRQDINFLDEKMSGINSFEIIMKGGADDFKQPENLEKLESIASQLQSDPNVLKVFSVADLVKIISKALHADSEEYFAIPQSETEIAQYLFLYEISGGDELNSFVDEDYATARMTIRTRQMPNLEQNEFIGFLDSIYVDSFEDMALTITGAGMLMNHINENLITTQVESVLMALGIILLLMFFMFGVKGGLLSLLPNLFPIIIFMGLMGLLGVELNMATSIIAAVVIGIVVDDTIHFFFGYKKAIQQLNNQPLALTNTMSGVGSALCVTSFILAIGFGILSFSSSRFIGDFGIMSASAIVAALIGDLFISPVTVIKSKLFLSK